MTEHFTREEAETWEALQIADKGRNPVAVYMQAGIDALRATTAKLKGWDAQGDKAYKRGFSDGMKEAPTGESWIRAIDEAMVGAHIGVAEMADDYGTAKKKLNALICWSVQVDRDLSRTQATPAVGAPDACVWTPDTDYETDVHYSACGEAWSFIEGGPKENKVRFCQGCGKPVKLTYQPEIGGV